MYNMYTVQVSSTNHETMCMFTCTCVCVVDMYKNVHVHVDYLEACLTEWLTDL